MRIFAEMCFNGSKRRLSGGQIDLNACLGFAAHPVQAEPLSEMPYIASISNHISDARACDRAAAVGEFLVLPGEGIMQPLGAFAGFDQPSIGLRPFKYSDHKYFFGRDNELDALERQIKRNRFVAVVGRAGSGKSSLISAGLRPRLERVADRRWYWIEIRPGEAPIRELAMGLAGLTGKTGDLLEAWADRFEVLLDKSSFGLGEALALIPALRGSEGNMALLFVDQFEELFSFANGGCQDRSDLVAAAERWDEATKFACLLLAATKSPQLPVHVIASIRSEFIGDCARFHGLPEAVSQSQFLVPGMTRAQREDVIRKSVQIAGGQVDPGLLQRALNDSNDGPGQLPNLQRALMRYWERASHRRKHDVNDLPHVIGDYARSVAVT
jgi:hypothetical protein